MVSAHAFAVHFPVALLVVSTGFYLVALLTRRDVFTTLFLWNSSLGLLGLAAAVITGQFQVDAQITQGNFHSVFEVHQNLAYTTLSLFYGVFVWYLVRRKKMSRVEQWLVMVVQCSAVWLVIYTAHMGGTLVYEHGAGVTPVQQLQHGAE